MDHRLRLTQAVPTTRTAFYFPPQRLFLAVCLSLALQPRIAEAQVVAPAPSVAGSFTLSGTVRAEATGSPLPYTTVTIEEMGRERFTDEAGTFHYYALTPGKYRVRVRQVGYVPVDSTLQLSASNSDLVFTLEKVPSLLEAVQVKAPPRECIVPEENGYVGDPDLATVLGEARKNAERERLLRRTYPFEYKLAQAHDVFDVRDSTHKIMYDTMTFRSDDDWRYREGRVVSGDRSKLFGEVRVMRLPALTDLADQRFLLAHCFKYAGTTDEYGAPAHRIDFAPRSNITAPDVEGSIYIDSATFIVRRAEFRLTRGGTIKPVVIGMKVTTTYREILPNVPLFDQIKSVQPMLPDAPGDHPTEFRQTQQLLSFRFLYRGPPGSEAIRVWKSPTLEVAPGVPNLPVLPKNPPP